MHPLLSEGVFFGIVWTTLKKQEYIYKYRNVKEGWDKFRQKT
jgi:hypothetical protein